MQLEDLNDVALFELFKFLDLNSLANLALTSKRFKLSMREPNRKVGRFSGNTVTKRLLLKFIRAGELRLRTTFVISGIEASEAVLLYAYHILIESSCSHKLTIKSDYEKKSYLNHMLRRLPPKYRRNIFLDLDLVCRNVTKIIRSSETLLTVETLTNNYDNIKNRSIDNIKLKPHTFKIVEVSSLSGKTVGILGHNQSEFSYSAGAFEYSKLIKIKPYILAISEETIYTIGTLDVIKVRKNDLKKLFQLPLIFLLLESNKNIEILVTS